METVLALLFVAVVLLVLLRRKLGKQRQQRGREFNRRLELVLLPGETVKVTCPQKTGHCVLTNKRVLFETKEGFTAVNLKEIKRTQGITEEGRKTTSLSKMKSLTIQAEKDYTITNTGEAFLDLTKQLTGKIKKQNDRKKTRKGCPKP